MDSRTCTFTPSPSHSPCRFSSLSVPSSNTITIIIRNIIILSVPSSNTITVRFSCPYPTVPIRAATLVSPSLTPTPEPRPHSSGRVRVSRGLADLSLSPYVSLSLSLYIYIYMYLSVSLTVFLYMCVCVYIYIYINTHTHTHTRIFTRLRSRFVPKSPPPRGGPLAGMDATWAMADRRLYYYCACHCSTWMFQW